MNGSESISGTQVCKAFLLNRYSGWKTKKRLNCAACTHMAQSLAAVNFQAPHSWGSRVTSILTILVRPAAAGKPDRQWGLKGRLEHEDLGRGLQQLGPVGHATTKDSSFALLLALRSVSHWQNLTVRRCC